MTQLSADWIRRLGAPHLPGDGRDAPADVFRDVFATVPVRVDTEALAQTPAFPLACQLYSARFFWESHTVFAALRDAALPGAAPRKFLEALMQLATACLKVRQQLPNAAERAAREAETLLAACRGLDVALDIDALISQCAAFRTAIRSGDPGEALMERPRLDPPYGSLAAC